MNLLIKLAHPAGIVLVALISVGLPVLADTYRAIEVSCPLGGVNARGVEITSQTFFDAYLDGEPIGHHGLPNPPPECPDNGFLVYKKHFSDQELARLKDYIFSKDYQSLRQPNTPVFYRLAKTLETLHSPIFDYYHYYLSALWEIPDGNDALYRHYARETIPVYQRALKDWLQHATSWPGEKAEAHMVLAELYRRIGNFALARKHLELTRENNPDFKFVHHSFIDYLDQLIKQKDSDAHSLGDRH